MGTYPDDEPRARIVTPRTRSYVHRWIIAVRDCTCISEHGELIENPAVFAAENEGHIWIVDDPAWVLNVMVSAHGAHPDFNYQIVTSEDTEPVRMVKSRVTRFGFRCTHDKDSPERETCPYRRRRAMHTVWSPRELSATPGKLLTDYSHGSLLELATDIREWCKEQNIPLPSTLAGIANSLLRDSRFWPEPRGRVPKATNENVRRFLPGVYSELRAERGRRYNAVALDQNTAYHRAAQDTPTPDPTTLFARGYFNIPESSPLWCKPGDELYSRTIIQPGIVYAQVEVRNLRKHEVRPPAVKNPGRYRVALWTNEIPLCERNGVTIEGLTAAWTATRSDEGLPRYGAFAERAITEASEYRKRWLKPTLHALYGLLATRPRRVYIGHLRGKSKRGMARIGFGHTFPVAQANLGVIQPITANVATLGVLQAEIRKRSFELAREFSEAGVTILHIHADGLHVEGELPLPPPGWKVEPLTNLEYLDAQSWLSQEGDCLPGRTAQNRMELVRHRADVIAHSAGIPGWQVPDTWNRVNVEDVTPEDSEPLYWPDGTKRHYVSYTESHSRTITPDTNRLTQICRAIARSRKHR